MSLRQEQSERKAQGKAGTEVRENSPAFIARDFITQNSEGVFL
jgi:hypothetical protein